jgi:ferredoxin
VNVKIDRPDCIICAVCWETCPEVFEGSPDDGFSQIVESLRIDGLIDQGNLPDALRECATKASDACPVQVIHLEKA